jgi:NAD(P)-dependent dehydrogenase (short-subunit alcohol dehydrogenase family)
MVDRVKDKVALVTGATRGIGEGISRLLASEGAKVVLTGIDAGAGARLAAELVGQGAEAIFLAADVRDAVQCQASIDGAVTTFGRLDILVNNAGIFPSASLEETTPQLWDDVFAVNVRGAFFCCRAAIPVMQRQQSGVIINIGSTLPFRGASDRFAYATSKGALLTLTRGLAQVYARDHIRANWITVGWVASPGEIELRSAIHGNGQSFLAGAATNRPFGRHEDVADIAAGVLYLASDEASHVTGCELNISGGMWT